MQGSGERKFRVDGQKELASATECLMRIAASSASSSGFPNYGGCQFYSWLATAKTRFIGASPYISHHLCMIGQIGDETRLLFCRCGTPWHLETRECLNDYLTTKVAKRSRWARG